MNRVDAVWGVGQLTLGSLVRVVSRLRVYGAERVPREGGLVVALNHYSWLDPGAFGTFSVRRGESDREAVRKMREVVRDGHALGLFVEGTRQRSGVPGDVKAGAGMVAVQEDVPVVCGVIHGSQDWRPGNFRPVSVAWGNPLRFEGLPRGAKGYREASGEIQREIRRLWEWLVEVHEKGRPKRATPPV